MAPMEAWWKSRVREITARAASMTASRRASASDEEAFAASSGAVLVQTDIVRPRPRIPGPASCQGISGRPVDPASSGRDDTLPFQIRENLLRALLDALCARVECQ